MKIEVLTFNKNSRKILSKNKNNFQIFLTIFLVIISLFFIINSKRYLLVVVDGILLYGTKILPALLPFFFITKLLSNFEIIFKFCNKFSFLTKKVFNTKSISAYIFFMSIISGYPIGAKLTSEFVENKILDKKDAQKILSFCSTSGPLFVIGTVGVGFFCDEKIGIIMFLSHIISSIINGIIFRGKKDSKIQDELPINFDKKFSLEDCMYSSIKSVLIVGGYIIIFFVLIQILLDYNFLYPLIKLLEFLGLSNIEAQGFCSGLIEITKGISILSKSSNMRLAFVLSSTLISFSGLSIILQSLTFLDKLKISKKIFVIQKITHAVITIGVSYILSFIVI